MEDVNFAEPDPGSSQARSALGSGVSEGIALLQSELQALEQVLMSSGAMVEPLGRLGARLYGLGWDTTPGRSLPDSQAPSIERIASADTRVLINPTTGATDPVGAPETAQLPLLSSPRPNLPQPVSMELVPLSSRFEKRSSGNQEAVPVTNERYDTRAEAKPLPAPVRQISAPPPSVHPIVTLKALMTSGTLASPLFAPPAHDEPAKVAEAEPLSLETEPISAPATRHSATVGATDGTAISNLGSFHTGTRLSKSIAPARSGSMRADLQKAGSVIGSPSVAADSTAEEVEEAPAGSTPAAAPVEAKQGVLILDGAELGRWIIDHLTMSMARPASGTTAIDPRMSAIYPGAPSGI